MITNKRLCALAGTSLLFLAGCATPARPSGKSVPIDLEATALPMFDGNTGLPLSWTDVMARVDSSTVIFMGEQHNDAVGHAVQLALVEETVNRWPNVSVSMEMLERDEQPIVEDYMEDVIDADQFEELTFSTGWAGDGSWTEWYQPIIDAVKSSKQANLVAANAPRRYVRLARRDGYERLEQLPPTRRQFVDYPPSLPEGPYRDRFFGQMSGAHDATSMDEESIEAMYRAQLVWDETMAASIDQALRTGAIKVIHIVGQFHSDFEGGTVQQFRLRQPGTPVLVISLRPDVANALREADHGRADVVVYTGRID